MPTAAFNHPRVIILSPHLLKNNSSLFKISKKSKKAREEARARAKAWHDQRQRQLAMAAGGGATTRDAAQRRRAAGRRSTGRTVDNSSRAKVMTAVTVKREKFGGRNPEGRGGRE